MTDPKVLSLFNEFNKKYFWGKLDKVRVTWSPRMTLCAGKTAYKVRGRSFSSCTIRLSQPLLTQRPHSDTVNTLLHEMIHAYLHVTQGLNYRDSHGPEFRKHMKRINSLHGSKITIYHNFHREVNKFRIHVYRCDGPCVSRRPFYGVLRRAIERPPGPTDRWWQRHAQECGGTFHKIEGPGAKPMPNSQKLGNKPNKEKVPQYQSEGSFGSKKVASFNQGRMINSKGNMDKHKLNPGSSSAKTKAFDEESVLQRIREKYSNTRQTKLLSMDETPDMILGANCKLVEGRMNYNYQAKSPTKIKVDKYIRKFRQAKNLFSTDDSEPGSSARKSVAHSPDNTQRSHNIPSLSVCPICSERIPDAMYEQHLNQCFGEDINFDSEFNDEKSMGSKAEASIDQNQDVWEALSDTKTCHNCGSVVLAAEMKLHLQYCIDSDDEDDESFDDRNKKFHESKDFEDKPGPGIVSCPSCMERVREEQIQEHLDQCLTFLAEEF
ncbi:DNA-dependent metalloprotease dvc-1-like isoform X2 [Penaeus chinensis]|nr:DNA-dependent metalloprotease dvc-1-like isoform X2 [Penaeus chinensis]XP_047469053.1 DNA-dependent metalloprotease dvc-1-like isoform X2 [Penaeus chinensis]